MGDVEYFFFFKQKTAYEITEGDWSSDVCSSDLNGLRGPHQRRVVVEGKLLELRQRRRNEHRRRVDWPFECEVVVGDFVQGGCALPLELELPCTLQLCTQCLELATVFRRDA